MYEMTAHDRQKVDEFLCRIAAWEGAYELATFSFLAVREEASLRLVQGHVILPTGRHLPPPLQVTTPSICACSVRLSTLGLDCEALIDAILADGIETPIGKLTLGGHTPDSTAASAHLEKFPNNFYDTLAHTLYLSLSYSQHAFTNRQAEFQNDLRAGDMPYDSITELAIELGLRSVRWDTCTVDFSANNVVAADLQREIVGGTAKLALLAAHGIDLKAARLGYRVLSSGRVVARRSVGSDELAWRDTEPYRVGELDVQVPDGALVQCFASYDGQWLHQGWVVQPGSYANVRRVAHEALDVNFENTRKYLFDEKIHKQDSRHLECGVANLLYMLGFSVDPLFGKLMTDNPDLLASTSSGDIVVVECTTGAIDNDGKLTKLLARTTHLVEKLRQAGHAHVRCLPVIVTSIPRSSITNLQSATDAGIVVASFEDLEAALTKTMVPQNSDVLFNERWQSVHPVQDSIFPDTNEPANR